MRAAAGAISRARARARVNLENADDFIELWEFEAGQRWVTIHLANA